MIGIPITKYVVMLLIVTYCDTLDVIYIYLYRLSAHNITYMSLYSIIH